MTLEQIKELARYAAKGTAPANFECANVNEALHDALKELCGSIHDINNFERNKYDIFDIIMQNADEIIPNKVISAMGTFAEVQQVPQGQKVLFKRGVGKDRARKFLTQVGLSGVYETFRLDNEVFTVETKAIGGGVTMDFERFLDGNENLSELMDIIAEGLVDAVYGEVQKAMVAAINNTKRPAANKYSANSFVPAEMLKLVTTVKSYAPAAVIFAPPEFINAMGADAIVPGGASYQAIYSPDDIENIHFNGRIKIFRGTPIVEIPQSYIDQKNVKTWINPRYAYILPVGKEKVVKVVLEGSTQIYDRKNRDQSIEIMAYKKMGCAILHHHDWAVYENTGITDTSYWPYGNN